MINPDSFVDVNDFSVGDPLFCIVNLDDEAPDHKLFNYALCECCLKNEAIKFPKQGIGTFHQFECPRCGKSLGYVELKNGYLNFNLED